MKPRLRFSGFFIGWLALSAFPFPALSVPLPLTMEFGTATAFTASTAPAYQSTLNNRIIGIMIEITGTGEPLDLTALSIDVSSCLNFTNDVSMVRVFYTGNDSSFSTDTLFWAGLDLVQPVTGNQRLVYGTNYLWVCYDLNFYAIPGDTLDAACTSVTVDDGWGPHACLNPSPAGLRLVQSYIVFPKTLSGRIHYANTQETGLSNVQVLLNSGLNVQQVITGPNGTYQFGNLMPGVYQVVVVCYRPWGGVNAVDALGILKHFVGMQSLSALEQLAGDVDISGFLNAQDGLMILRRFTGIIDMFPSGDWIFEPTTVYIDGTTNMVRNIKGLCYGDVNHSYVP